MKKYLKILGFCACLSLTLYGLGRLYFAVTAGFTFSNITSDLTYHENWQTVPLSVQEKEDLKKILSQKFTYLGKGCQSYVFASEDDDYVIKFVKYQRFRPQKWLDYVAFIPGVDKIREQKIVKKELKLDMLFASWKLAYEQLKEESGLVYIHLNKSNDLNQKLTIVDKMGFSHVLNLDDMEFMVQKKATMLCSTITDLMKQNKESEALALIDRLFKMILAEYDRGLADNDHALMQNTGVFKGLPVHIDIGQFMVSPEMKDEKKQQQELFSKTYKFRLWLKKNHPELEKKVYEMLFAIIGPDMETLVPQVKNLHAWSIASHDDP